MDWRTIILDEAQAIKNITAKRSQAAMGLKGEFKVITTGTPIENHLSELWTLFNFINPGLLGSYDRFNTQFAIPIEKYNDRDAKRRLKKLIQPFILRRTKSQVLEELPPRTEVVLQVEMSPEEAAFYEALRQQALERLARENAPAGQKHLMILAEIMRLRQACCNPRLVAANSVIPSSKLEVFGEIISELLENRHKALVFSQFVGHLSLIREHLDQRGVNYRYLDGSTPPKERKSEVDAFQAGDGDLFLISLKAGGLGLNLTAADYVIHMDPWWNPAVEDQASDRAHRIGQQHPVTVYRLVARNTIEEKIVKLHQDKRDLAGSLLEGSDISGKVSAEELLKLIQEQ
jgi:SNF2 family DNA or RNA helicase